MRMHENETEHLLTSADSWTIHRRRQQMREHSQYCILMGLLGMQPGRLSRCCSLWLVDVEYAATPTTVD